MLPSRTVNEKSGVFVNGNRRLQRLQALIEAPEGSLGEGEILARLAAACGHPLCDKTVAADPRALFREMVSQLPPLAGLTLTKIGELGVSAWS